MIPQNPYRLKIKDLEQVKTRLLEIVDSPEVETKDRVAAAKQISLIYDQIMKYAAPDVSPKAAEPENAVDPLRGLAIVG